MRTLIGRQKDENETSQKRKRDDIETEMTREKNTEKETNNRCVIDEEMYMRNPFHPTESTSDSEKADWEFIESNVKVLEGSDE